ncbi:hypothetical protein AMAG_19672 [Allomyces macrogynus ATCC 38327]|uniref:Uncharacterized protein n=1 Tax=Allomyces macrogynus (strain ATCC 38327) TaxID=578462 RepID=A0A0L0SXG6_ALLM3|nr:hypothetical protein AMAG_19672 [Allomyces macrogynus ATCC 38327]|eukprot:KNE67253.1 hypothetical protein AMAG_19672 [Allomyces macrogynus ATCC 38327]
MLTLDSLRSVNGVIAVLSALPRNGFGHLYVTLYSRDNFELEYDGESQDEMHAKLAASFPESVNQFSFYSTLDLPHLPLTKHALLVDVETLVKLDPLPFAPTLRRLELYSYHDYLTDTDTNILVRVFEHLPATLTHLKSLSLIYCDLTAANMDDYLTGQWPDTLCRLTLSGNYFTECLPTIPFGIRSLSVSVAEALLKTGGEAIVTTWVASLPSSLRVLDLHWTRLLPNADPLASILLQHLNIRVPGHTRRVQLRIVMSMVSAEMLVRLRDKFDLVDANMVRVSDVRPHPSFTECVFE